MTKYDQTAQRPQAKYLAIAAAIILFTVFISFIVMLHDSLEQEESLEAAQRYRTFESQVERLIYSNVILLKGFEAYIAAEPYLDEGGAYEYLNYLLADSLDYIRNIGVIEDTTILWNYPRDTNRAAIGVDLATIPVQRDLVLQVKKDLKPLVHGPLELVQGDYGFSVRHPILRNGQYWGQTSVVLKAHKILETIQAFADDARLNLAIYNSEDEDNPFFGSTAGFERYLVFQMDADFINWRVCVDVSGGPSNNLLLFSVLTALAAALSAAVGSFVLQYLKRYQEILNISTHDHLTGLFNRHFLHEYQRVLLRESQQQHRKPALLIIDLNSFKNINDTYGHDVGDQVLIETARILKLLTKEGGEAFRLGGDEFLILLPDLDGADDLARIQAEVNRLFIEDFCIPEYPIRIICSLGYARFPEDGRDFDTLLRVADRRLYRDKAQRREAGAAEIVERIQAEEALRESERSKSVFLSHLPGMAYRSKWDPNWTLEFVSEGCYALTGYQPGSLLNNREISYRDLIAPEYRDFQWQEWGRVLDERTSFRAEYELVDQSGRRKWVLELGQGMYDADGNVEALEGIVLDISDRKQKEHQITYLREHDLLTNLYNRSHLDQELRRLNHPEYWPLSIAICDIDGLRVVNDAYGHAEGDRLIAETAQLIQGQCRSEDVLARVGGGEFVLLLPRTGSRGVEQLKQRIKEAVDQYNHTKKALRYDINLSMGYGTKISAEQSIADTLKSAEEFLKRRKLLNQHSSHSTIVSSIMATLYAKSQETEEHGQRMAETCHMMGLRLGFDQKSLDDLQLLAKLHDIGKIGIDDGILNKPGKLTEEEWQQMRQHPEIGHRIAIASPQLEHIAEYILHHHERWDGGGYPAGLSGTEIPLLSRILAVADAYDAMTKDRIYRRALSKEDALLEIERNAGTQFDPTVVRILLENAAALPALPAT